MRRVTIAIGMAAAVAATGAVMAQQNRTDENGCRVLKRSELDRDADLAGATQAGTMSSSVTAGNGAVSGSTITGGSGTSTSVTAGNGRVTTSNTMNGKTVTSTTPGTGASASASSSDGDRTVMTTSDGGCTVVMEKE